jgi:hypothetical protein
VLAAPVKFLLRATRIVLWQLHFSSCPFRHKQFSHHKWYFWTLRLSGYTFSPYSWGPLFKSRFRERVCRRFSLFFLVLAGKCQNGSSKLATTAPFNAFSIHCWLNKTLSGNQSRLMFTNYRRLGDYFRPQLQNLALTSDPDNGDRYVPWNVSNL